MPSAGLCRRISLRPASGRYRKGSDLGIIRRADSASKPIFLPSPRERTPQISASLVGDTSATARPIGVPRSVVLQNYAGRVEPRRAVIVAPGRSHRLLLGIIRNSATLSAVGRQVLEAGSRNPRRRRVDTVAGRYYAAAFFAAHRFFIAILSAFRPAAVMPLFCLAAFAGAFAGAADSPLIF